MFFHLFCATLSSSEGVEEDGNKLASSMSNSGLKSGPIVCSMFALERWGIFDPVGRSLFLKRQMEDKNLRVNKDPL